MITLFIPQLVEVVFIVVVVIHVVSVIAMEVTMTGNKERVI